MRQIYIIEHLEPKIGRWTLIEYAHISKIVGKRSLWFTNIKHRSKKLGEHTGGFVLNFALIG